MDSKRQQQIANAIQKEFSQILLREVNHVFPSNVLISVTKVSITPDLSIARIYFSIFNAKRNDEVMDTLNSMHNELKRMLGNRLRMLRRIPELEFYYDESLQHAQKIDEILKKVKKDNQKSGE